MLMGGEMEERLSDADDDLKSTLAKNTLVPTRIFGRKQLGEAGFYGGNSMIGKHADGDVF